MQLKNGVIDPVSINVDCALDLPVFFRKHETIMKIFKSSPLAAGITLSLLLPLMACQHTPESTQTGTLTNQPQAIATERRSDQALNGLQLNQQTVLLGDQLRINQRQIDVSSELLDHRGTTIATVDEQNRLVLVNTDASSNEPIRYSSPLPYVLETLCLYQAEELQVFLLDERHMAHQMLIQVNNSSLKLTKLREFPMPPASEYCIVDDRSESLFVAEEHIGVWRYNARAESEVSRQPVALVAPHGRLISNSGPLAISNNLLWVAEAGSHRFHALALNNYRAMSSYSLRNSIAIDTLTASASGQTNQLLLLDDASGELLSARIEQQAKPGTDRRIINVAATAETDPVTTDGDAADDPAIWVHPTQPEKSRILATNKKYGLHVYDLNGNTLQTLVSGRVNNVDVRQNFYYKGKTADIAAASQRDNNSIALYHIDSHSGETTAVGEIATSLDEVYGLCMGRGGDGEVYVFINDEDGRFEQYQITDSTAGWHGKRVRQFAVATQPEGCVSDDSQQRLFLGEENNAIWTLDLNDPHASLTLIQSLKDQLTNHLYADIEGMDIYHGDEKSYLVVSSQGNDSYVLFDTQAPYQYAGHFRIGMNTRVQPVIDGASETDGLAVSSAYLGEGYPQGLLVVQDGRNLMPQQFQNFKLVSWKAIRETLSL